MTAERQSMCHQLLASEDFLNVKMQEQFWFGVSDLILIIWAAAFGENSHDSDNLLAIRTMFKTFLPPPLRPIFIELLHVQVHAAAIANVNQSSLFLHSKEWRTTPVTFFTTTVCSTYTILHFWTWNFLQFQPDSVENSLSDWKHVEIM